MIPERGKLIKRFLPFMLAGLLVIILYVYFFVDIYEMITFLRKANPLYYSLAVVALLLDTLFFSLTWHCFLDRLSLKAPF
ncbi:MAG: hypothetical protein OEX09_06260, partial [Candidatus Bathyarchaeota archaeon]|nr:hypothetical protein [Candidatus Bathyarchaeota archaeon]